MMVSVGGQQSTLRCSSQDTASDVLGRRLIRSLHSYSEDQPAQGHVAIKWRRKDSNQADAVGWISAV